MTKVPFSVFRIWVVAPILMSQTTIFAWHKACSRFISQYQFIARQGAWGRSCGLKDFAEKSFVSKNAGLSWQSVVRRVDVHRGLGDEPNSEPG
jgi:hypothetical protein